MDVPERTWPKVTAGVFCRLGAVGMVAAILAMSGCGKKPPDFTPTVLSAEDAVRRGLDAWKAGQPPGELPGKPVIHVSDVGRKPNQTLESYQILGETRGSAGRTIAVNLRLANPEQEVKARYIVVGIDPLWVFRQEDYELLMHWDHHMPAEKESQKAPADESVVERKGGDEKQPQERPIEAAIDREGEAPAEAR